MKKRYWGSLGTVSELSKRFAWIIPDYSTLSGFAGLALCLFCCCGIYTFSGSTLPSHLKTVDIPLFANTSLQANVAEEITDSLSKRVLSTNLMRIVPTKGDATISGSVTQYSNTPRSYGNAGVRSVNISEYEVHIVVDVEFADNKKNSQLFKGTITGKGVYDFQNQTEDIGRKKAEQDIVDQILQNSLQSW
jgi:hypothetical protein